MQLNDLRNITSDFKSTTEMPVMFIGHGNPMNGIADNAFTRALGKMGQNLPQKPSAILVISAHWLTKGTHVLVAPQPETIHDFGGFHQNYTRCNIPHLARRH